MRNNYIESNIEENREMKEQFLFKNLPVPTKFQESDPKSFVDVLINTSSIKRNTGHVKFTNHNLDKGNFVNPTSYPAIGQHIAAKCYIDEAISNSVDESLLLSFDPNEEVSLDEQRFMFLNSSLTSPETEQGIPIRAYVDSLSEIKEVDKICL